MPSITPWDLCQVRSNSVQNNILIARAVGGNQRPLGGLCAFPQAKVSNRSHEIRLGGMREAGSESISQMTPFACGDLVIRGRGDYRYGRHVYAGSVANVFLPPTALARRGIKEVT